MRYMYVLIVITAMAFVAAGSARGQASGNNIPASPSKSCPNYYTYSGKLNCCVPITCQKGYSWTASKGCVDKDKDKDKD